MLEIDELKIYSGDDIEITPQIIVTQPTLRQIKDFGERKYFNAVHTLTAVGADLKWQLWDLNQTDYTKIEDYDLFIGYISQVLSSKKNKYADMVNQPEKYKSELEKITSEDIQTMLFNPLQLVLKDIDFADFEPYKRVDNQQVVLYNAKNDIVIDRLIYSQIVDVVRKIHGLKRNNQIPANEQTKMDLIEDARDEAMAAASRPYKSMLMPLVSSLIVWCKQCGDSKIWDMKINTFLHDLKRVSKIQDSQALLQGAYSGFTSLKGIDKTRLDWAGEI